MVDFLYFINLWKKILTHSHNMKQKNKKENTKINRNDSSQRYLKKDTELAISRFEKILLGGTPFPQYTLFFKSYTLANSIVNLDILNLTDWQMKEHGMVVD